MNEVIVRSIPACDLSNIMTSTKTLDTQIVVS